MAQWRCPISGAVYSPVIAIMLHAYSLCVVMHQADLVILEEPEHLNWYHASARWSQLFNHVVGVIHTNYSAYARALPGGMINLAAVGLVSRAVCRLHCHKVWVCHLLGSGLWTCPEHKRSCSAGNGGHRVMF